MNVDSACQRVMGSLWKCENREQPMAAGRSFSRLLKNRFSITSKLPAKPSTCCQATCQSAQQRDHRAISVQCRSRVDLRTSVLIMWRRSHLSNFGQAWSQTDTPRSWEHAPLLDWSKQVQSRATSTIHHPRTHRTSAGPNVPVSTPGGATRAPTRPRWASSTSGTTRRSKVQNGSVFFCGCGSWGCRQNL